MVCWKMSSASVEESMQNSQYSSESVEGARQTGSGDDGETRENLVGAMHVLVYRCSIPSGPIASFAVPSHMSGRIVFVLLAWYCCSTVGLPDSTDSNRVSDEEIDVFIK